MTYPMILALVVTIVAIYALIKRYETRFVLLTAGFVMAIGSLNPLAAFQQFDASLTNAKLIIPICSALGFAAVISLTKCDVHLVSFLTKPLQKLGLALLPMCMVVVSIISIAIPSTSGLVAAVGPTLIPLMIRSGFHPAIAAAAVIGSINAAYLSPGVAHNSFVAKLADMTVIDFIKLYAPTTIAIAVAAIVLIFIVCILNKDYQPNALKAQGQSEATSGAELPDQPKLLYAIAPLVPIAILLGASIWAPQLHLSVSSAMIIGAVYALLVTRTKPVDATKKFFDGMGKGFGNILGIIVAAGVFAAGLKACGVIEAFTDFLTHANHWAKVGGAFGPYAMALVTGSGDAAAFAFNEAISAHAAQFGLTPDALGYLAALSGSLGRLSSPLAGGMIIAAGIAGVSPFAIVRRTAPVMFIILIGLYFVS